MKKVEKEDENEKNTKQQQICSQEKEGKVKRNITTMMITSTKNQ